MFFFLTERSTKLFNQSKTEHLSPKPSHAVRGIIAQITKKKTFNQSMHMPSNSVKTPSLVPLRAHIETPFMQ